MDNFEKVYSEFAKDKYINQKFGSPKNIGMQVRNDRRRLKANECFLCEDTA
jgi:hypothetical protein